MASNSNESLTHGAAELLTPTTVLQLCDQITDTQTSYIETQPIYQSASENNLKRKYSSVGSDYQTNESPINYSVRQYNTSSDPEEERKRIRRERNKIAAAKCRQKRTDLTNKLQDEVDSLDTEANQLRETLRELEREKEQLEFVLQAHRPMCLMEKVPAADIPVNLSTRVVTASRPTCLSMNSTQTPTQLILPPKKSPSRAKHFPDAFKSVKVENELNTPTSDTTVQSTVLYTPFSESKPIPVLRTPVSESRSLDIVTADYQAGSCASQVRRSTSDSGSDVRSPPTIISL